MYRTVAFGASNSASSLDPAYTIRNLTQDLCTAFNTGNYDQAAALFRPDAEFMPTYRESSQGSKAIERVFREWGDQGYADLRFETTSVDSSGDMAVETGRYSLTIRHGTNTVADAGKYLRSWRRLGAWLITADCWSSNIPLADEVRVGQGKVA